MASTEVIRDICNLAVEDDCPGIPDRLIATDPMFADYVTWLFHSAKHPRGKHRQKKHRAFCSARNMSFFCIRISLKDLS